jgi:hypothetical protein
LFAPSPVPPTPASGATSRRATPTWCWITPVRTRAWRGQCCDCASFGAAMVSQPQVLQQPRARARARARASPTRSYGRVTPPCVSLTRRQQRRRRRSARTRSSPRCCAPCSGPRSPTRARWCAWTPRSSPRSPPPPRRFVRPRVPPVGASTFHHTYIFAVKTRFN